MFKSVLTRFGRSCVSVVALTNGSLLYLPTKAAFAAGGYEPHVSALTPQAELDFTTGVTELLQTQAK